MIKSIKLQNFQSHQDSSLEFHPGVNVIVGSSDSGKTAILRALRWVVWNRPTGDDFRSHWGGETRVEVNVEEGTIKRVKGKENVYYMGEEKFKAFGTEVPEEIQQTLNLQDVNLQRQLDSPFLLTSSPGEVANHFNKVANLDLIGEATRSVTSWLKEEKRKLDISKSELSKNKEELRRYENLPELEGQLEQLESLQEQADDLKRSKEALKQLISSIEKTDREEASYSSLLELEPSVDLIIRLVEKKKQRQDERQKLDQTINNLQEVQDSHDEHAYLLKLEPQVKESIGYQQGRDQKQTERENLQKLIGRLETAEAHLRVNNHKIQKLEKELKEGFPEICPLCGSYQKTKNNGKKKKG